MVVWGLEHATERKPKMVFSQSQVSPLMMTRLGCANKRSTMYYRQIKISMYDRQNGQDEDAAK